MSVQIRSMHSTEARPQFKDQSSGDVGTLPSSHLCTNCRSPESILTPSTTAERRSKQMAVRISIFHPEPGSSLAAAIGEQVPVCISDPSYSNRTTMQTRSSTGILINNQQPIKSIPSMLSDITNEDGDELVNQSNIASEVYSSNGSGNPKYKTELCRNFTAYGCCSYSSRCQFAHGLHELRCRTRHPKYKTEICRNFLSGYCKYGSRCQFLHTLAETKETVQHQEFGSAPVPNSLAPPSPPTDCLAATGTSPFPLPFFVPMLSDSMVALSTYLLTNMLAQSAAFNFAGPIVHQSALAALAACTNFYSKSALSSSVLTELVHQQRSFVTNANVNRILNHPLSISRLQSATHCQSQPHSNPHDQMKSSLQQQQQQQSNNNRRTRKSSAHI